MATRPHPHATYRVEKIIAISILEDNLKFYKVQWAPSWVADTNLNECENLVAEFLNRKTLQGHVDSNNEEQNATQLTIKQESCESGVEVSSLPDVKVELEDDENEDAVESSVESTGAKISAEEFPNDLPYETTLIDESDEEEKPTVVESGYDDNAVGHYDNHVEQPSILVDDAADSLVSDDVEISEVTFNTDNYRDDHDQGFSQNYYQNTKIKPGFGPDSYSGFKSRLAHENHKSDQCSTTGYGISQQTPYHHSEVFSSDQNCTRARMSEMDHIHNDSMAVSESWSSSINAMPNTNNNGHISNPTYSDTNAADGNSTGSQTTDNVASPSVPEILTIPTADENGMFKCPHCPRSFPLKHKLMRHYTCHTRPYTCHECNKSFGRKDNLKRHMIQHLVRQVPRVVKCSLCGSSFADKEGYLGHFTEHHVGDPSMHFRLVSGVHYDDTGGLGVNDVCKDEDNLGGGSSFVM